MNILIKDATEIQKMRVAGRLAAQVVGDDPRIRASRRDHQ